MVVVVDLNLGGLCKFGSHLIMDTKGLLATTIVLPTHVSGRCSFLFFFVFFMLLVEVPDWWMCLQNLGGCCSFAGEKKLGVKIVLLLLP